MSARNPHTMRRHREYACLRVGIDFGGTIGLVDQKEPFPCAFDMIRHLIHKFGPTNVFVVSKAGPSMVLRTREWFQRTDFYRQTELLPENVIFVRDYSDKADVVRSHNINIFFDDSVKVVRCLAPLPMIQRIFWMGAKPEDIRLIAKGDRQKIAITKSWATTMKFFQRIGTDHADSGSTGTNAMDS